MIKGVINTWYNIDFLRTLSHTGIIRTSERQQLWRLEQNSLGMFEHETRNISCEMLFFCFSKLGIFKLCVKLCVTLRSLLLMECGGFLQ